MSTAAGTRVWHTSSLVLMLSFFRAFRRTLFANETNRSVESDSNLWSTRGFMCATMYTREFPPRLRTHVNKFCVCLGSDVYKMMRLNSCAELYSCMWTWFSTSSCKAPAGYREVYCVHKNREKCSAKDLTEILFLAIAKICELAKDGCAKVSCRHIQQIYFRAPTGMDRQITRKLSISCQLA
jgi:hypothetical protein